MNARLKQAQSRPADDWEEFRPARSSQRSSRSVARKLLASAFLFAAMVLIWVMFKPRISGTVAGIRSVISGLGRSPVASSPKQRVAAEKKRRGLRPSSAYRPEPETGGTALRPFEVYLLDGDRYIRVAASDRSVLLNTETGETTWIDSDSMAGNRK